MEAISKCVGTGKVKNVPLIECIDLENYEFLTIDLKLKGTTLENINEFENEL